MSNLSKMKKDELIKLVEEKTRVLTKIEQELVNCKNKLANVTRDCEGDKSTIKKLANDLDKANSNVYQHQKAMDELTKQKDNALEKECIALHNAKKNKIVAIVFAITTIVLCGFIIF